MPESRTRKRHYIVLRWWRDKKNSHDYSAEYLSVVYEYMTNMKAQGNTASSNMYHRFTVCKCDPTFATVYTYVYWYQNKNALIFRFN